MFKKFIMTTVLFCLTVVDGLQASVQIAIAAKDFYAGNSLILITRDSNGCEQVAGCVSLEHGKTQFSSDDISCSGQNVSSFASQTTAIIADVQQDSMRYESNDLCNCSDELIYLYFEVDPKVNIIRVLVMKNNLLEDNPFNVLQFSAPLDFDEEDDLFGEQDDELSAFTNLSDIHVDEVHLSTYDKMKLAAYAMWTIQTTQLKQTYKNFTEWFTSRYDR